MKMLHVVSGLDNPLNGIAVAAKLIADEQAAEIVDAREFGKVKDLAKYEEVWVHSCWLPATLRACWKVLMAKRLLVRMTHANLDPVRLRYHGWKKWLVGSIERYFLRRCEKIVATCDAEKAWIEAYLGKKCSEIVVEDIKRFFDLKGERGMGNGEMGSGERDENSNNKKLNVLYLGRRHPLKGVEFLEAAVRQLQNSTRSTRSTRLKIELKIVSNAFGEELEKVWEWCDVLVLPTLSENFGLVVAEALERGKRVITTDGAPAWEEDCSLELELGEIWSGYGGRLLYLKGYRYGTKSKRIELLKKAIRFFAKG